MPPERWLGCGILLRGTLPGCQGNGFSWLLLLITDGGTAIGGGVCGAVTETGGADPVHAIGQNMRETQVVGVQRGTAHGWLFSR